MKRVLSFLVVLCLALSVFTVASAASITILQQPETQTVKAGGNLTFVVKAKGNYDSVTWYFTNPLTGQVTTGRKLEDVVSGVSVKNPNSLKLTLRKIPESMHGWTLRCHIGPKNGGVSTDTVMILIAGLEPPVFTPAPTSTPIPNTATAMTSAGTSQGGAQATVVQMKEPIVIKGSNKFELYALDGKGNVTGDAQTELKFTDGDANFFVLLPEGAEGPIQYIKIGGLRLTPTGDVTGMSVRGWKESASVTVKIRKPVVEGQENGVSATMAALQAEQEKEKEAIESVDASSLVTVTCTNCRFSGWNNRFAQSGQVPVGTTITVVSDGGWIHKGYSINGAKAVSRDQASIQLVIEEDTTISMEKQK